MITIEKLGDLAPDEVVLVHAYRKASELDRRASITLLSLLLKSVLEPSVPDKVIDLRTRGKRTVSVGWGCLVASC